MNRDSAETGQHGPCCLVAAQLGSPLRFERADVRPDTVHRSIRYAEKQSLHASAIVRGGSAGICCELSFAHATVMAQPDLDELHS